MFGGTDAHDRGLEVRRQLYGDAQVESGHESDTFGADFGALADEVIYGGIWARPGLDLKTRVLVTVAVDVALGRYDYAAAHLQSRESVGITMEELVELAMQIAAYAGMPAGNSLIRVLNALREDEL